MMQILPLKVIWRRNIKSIRTFSIRYFTLNFLFNDVLHCDFSDKTVETNNYTGLAHSCSVWLTTQPLYAHVGQGTTCICFLVVKQYQTRPDMSQLTTDLFKKTVK